MFKEWKKYSCNESTNKESQERNGNYEEEPSGNSRTEKFKVITIQNLLDGLNSRLEPVEDSMNWKTQIEIMSSEGHRRLKERNSILGRVKQYL